MLDEAETLVKQKVADAKAVEEGKEAAEPVEPAYKYEPKTVTEWAVQNDNKPLWTRSPREVRRMGSEALRSDGVLHHLFTKLLPVDFDFGRRRCTVGDRSIQECG